MDDGHVNGQNELVRLRTRTGHQILMHNSQDLIYIANSKGTAWIELTSNGKIDIFAQDSVSIHTENDFNFRADRDINLEAGRNIHIRADGNMETNIVGHYFLNVDKDAKISVTKTYDKTIGGVAKVSVANSFNLNVAGDIKETAGASFNIGAESNINIGTAATLNLGANGQIIASGSVIHLNGPAAAAPSSAENAAIPPDLPLFTLPNRKANSGWSNGEFYKAPDIKSIMQRVPTHEPWDQHENINPPKVEPPKTDVTLADRTADGIPPNPASAAARASGQVSQNTPPVEPTNPPVVVPGTCTIEYARAINKGTSGFGIDALKTAAEKYGLKSPYAVASLLGICGGETLWEVKEENFNYTANRLLQVFPSIFKGDRSLAEKYAGNPNNSLPEFLYGYQGAKGRELGNKEPGDGTKFIGRGYIQITGRANYEKYGKLMKWDLVKNPKLLNRPDLAAESAVIYLLDRVKLDQTNPGYFEAACKAVGNNTADIKAKKKGFYECFLGQLQGQLLGTGSGGIVTDGQGNPIRTGSGG
jgi:putative chitinase